MSSPISYNSTLGNNGKINGKTLEKDSNGYYLICLGAINSFNKKGEFYLADGFENMLTDSNSTLATKLKEGCLNGEANHPSIGPNMTKADYLDRVLRVELNNVSHHIKGIYTKPTNIPCGISGKGNVIAIMGWVKPIGKLGETLRDALENPDQNVCFSVRSFTNDERIGGVTYKKFACIITWDWVVTPGIAIANKFDTLGMESMFTTDIDMKALNNVYLNIQNKKVSNEDDKTALAYINTIKRSVDVSDTTSELLKNW